MAFEADHDTIILFAKSIGIMREYDYLVNPRKGCAYSKKIGVYNINYPYRIIFKWKERVCTIEFDDTSSILEALIKKYPNYEKTGAGYTSPNSADYTFKNIDGQFIQRLSDCGFPNDLCNHMKNNILNIFEEYEYMIDPTKGCAYLKKSNVNNIDYPYRIIFNWKEGVCTIEFDDTSSILEALIKKYPNYEKTGAGYTSPNSADYTFKNIDEQFIQALSDCGFPNDLCKHIDTNAFPHYEKSSMVLTFSNKSKVLFASQGNQKISDTIGSVKIKDCSNFVCTKYNSGIASINFKRPPLS